MRSINSLSSKVPIYLIPLLLLFAISPAYPLEKDERFSIGGYYKNLFSVSKTLADKEEYFLHLQRMRFEVNQVFTDQITATVMYDNEVIFNNFSDTADFDLIREKDQRRLAFFDLEDVFFDEEHVFWKHAVYRAYVKYFTPSFQCTVGKQGVDWSRMRFYHPFDLFNPISPLDIEKDEKIGVDAVNVELYPKPFMLINFIYAPYENKDKQGFGLRLGGKIKDYDIFLIGSEVKKDRVLGFGFDGYLMEAGFRGELTYTYKDNHDHFFRSSVGLDHSITPKLYGLIEYFYNGDANIDNRGDFLGSYEFSRRAMSITRHILGAGIEYELTGITKLNNYAFYDFEGTSLYYNPEFKWNIRPNFDLTVGAQVFEGDDESEYGDYHNVYYGELKFFF